MPLNAASEAAMRSAAERAAFARHARAGLERIIRRQIGIDRLRVAGSSAARP